MRIAFVVNRIETEDSDYATSTLATAAIQRGHDVYVTEVGDLTYLENGHISFLAIKVSDGKVKNVTNYLKLLHSTDTPMVKVTSEELDVIFLRNNPCEDYGDRPWATTAGMIFGQIALTKGVLVVNDPFIMMTSFNKMYFQHFPEEVRPKTIITRDADEIKEFYKQQKEKIILKPLQGSGGKDVFLIDSSTNMNQIVETISRYDFIIAQEYLPAAKEGDIRVIMMNGKILTVKGKPAMLHRVNKTDDIRSNISVGGTGKKAQVTEDILRLCNIIGPKLKADGMFLVGVDIVGNKIMELNLESPGGLVSMEKLENEKFSAQVIQDLEKKIEYKEFYEGRLPNAFLATLEL
jgi:glutathione synthase